MFISILSILSRPAFKVFIVHSSCLNNLADIVIVEPVFTLCLRHVAAELQTGEELVEFAKKHPMTAVYFGDDKVRFSILPPQVELWGDIIRTRH